MVGGNNVRLAQNRNALVASRLSAQLGEPTVRGRRTRFFGGPLGLPARNVAPPTTMALQRLLLQGGQVQRELSLGSTIAGPGVIQ